MVPMVCRVRGVPLDPGQTNLAWIPAGTFAMGSPDSEPARDSYEGPQTQVTISRGFWMGRYEVTQGEYLSVIGSNPSYFRNGMPTYSEGTGGDVTNELRHPVETVSWIDATNYCGRLTARELALGRLPVGYAYRLPTEAEWEYACRAGTTTAFHYGPALWSGMANFRGQYEYPPCGSDTNYCSNPSGVYLGRTTSVGSYAPNAWGLYDMHGNVFEWCQDWSDWALPGGRDFDPQGPPMGLFHVFRGGNWYGLARACRSAGRYGIDPDYRLNDLGFRVVLAPSQP